MRKSNFFDRTVHLNRCIITSEQDFKINTEVTKNEERNILNTIGNINKWVSHWYSFQKR